MKTILIWAFILFTISIKLFAQLGPDGIGIVNGYRIEPNTNLSPSKPKYLAAGYYPVSYTHLTLPTIYSV